MRFTKGRPNVKYLCRCSAFFSRLIPVFPFQFADKAKKKYANLGDSVQIVHLEKSHRGLGISLAGHKDRNRMAVFVCGLNPNGTAYKTGGIQVGDEILEVREELTTRGI